MNSGIPDGISNGSGGKYGGPPEDYRHVRIRSAPHSLHSQTQSNSELTHRRPQSAHISHHPNAINRYPFSIPSVSAKLDQPHHADGSDALSSLWKKTTPLQEPYFQTRHTIASQHTLSTLGGVLFSLDEVPLEFNKDMYIAMRNRIFELEAKSVDYSPFSHSRKRSIERSGYDEYPERHSHSLRHPKRTANQYPQQYPRHHGQSEPERPSSPIHRLSSSYPSWYTPEVYSNGSNFSPPPLHPHRPSERDQSTDFRISSDQIVERERRPPSPSGGHLRGLIGQRAPSSGHLGHTGHDPRSPHTQSVVESRPPLHHPGDQSDHNGAAAHSHHPPTHSHPPVETHHTQTSSQHHPPQSTHPRQHTHLSHNSQQSAPPHQPPSQGHHQQLHNSIQKTTPHPIQPAPLHPSQSTSGPGAQSPLETSNSTPQQRQSFHQQQHRAQQQAQSAHSRSYHLQKHMRMLDQQRAAQLSQQQQQQQQQQTLPSQSQSSQSQKTIQRHYQSHQQMYPQHHPIAIKPYPQRTQPALSSTSNQKPLQAATSQAGQAVQHAKPASIQQQMIQRYQQQRALQLKQQQLRQLQYLRSRSAVQYPIQKNARTDLGASAGSHSPTPPRMFGPQVDRPIKKAERPLECSNCMALDSLKAWRPKTDSPASLDDAPSERAGIEDTDEGSKLLCSACTQYQQTHGKSRPVPPFRTNFLKKIHTRFKRELQEVRFQGWQDAQVLEIEDRMDESEFQMVFNGLDEGDVSQSRSRQSTVSEQSQRTGVASRTSSDQASTVVPATTVPLKVNTEIDPKEVDGIVIKIEDDDESPAAFSKSKPDDVDVRTFQSEASVGELFGHRWRTEPVVGYTLVHFGGSDRTRMVPMNPTVPSLTIKFNRKSESITFAFRVLVNGLCLLASGGGPPALHMPEMADDDESEEDDEIVVVPDDASASSPSSGAKEGAFTKSTDTLRPSEEAPTSQPAGSK
ncbi:hypothetical protein CPB97_004698 [Podila verticillata]|nr:hypothetical protein CPB97_004698 [Podila verticillata]